MALAVAAAAMAAFAAIFQLLKVRQVSGSLLATASRAQRILLDPLLGDDDKEPLVQQAARDMFGAIGHVGWRLAVCFAGPVTIILIADGVRLASSAEIVNWLLSWQLLLAATFALGAIWWTRR